MRRKRNWLIDTFSIYSVWCLEESLQLSDLCDMLNDNTLDVTSWEKGLSIYFKTLHTMNDLRWKVPLHNLLLWRFFENCAFVKNYHAKFSISHSRKFERTKTQNFGNFCPREKNPNIFSSTKIILYCLNGCKGFLVDLTRFLHRF